MEKLGSLYNKYFQKSRVFLYPQIQIPKDVGIFPAETFVKWDKITEKDRKFICVYKKREGSAFKLFEDTQIRKHKMFYSISETDKHKIIVFNFESIKDDWDKFLNGKYSKFSYQSKKNISGYFGSKTSQSVYIDSYINPHKYFEMYSKLLNESAEDLIKVGELCDKPNWEKETFNAYDPVWQL